MPTANFYIDPSDGWVEVASAPKFIRTSGYPHTHPYYVAAASSAPTLISGVGTGTATFSTAAPSDGDTVTVGSEVYTFRTTPTLPFEVAIGGSFAAAATNFTAYVNLHSTLVRAVDASSTVTLTSKLSGVSGNYALSTTASNIAVSGTTLTGGTDAVQGVMVCHHPFKVNVTMTEKLYVRTVNPVPNSNHRDGKLRLDVFTI